MNLLILAALFSCAGAAGSLFAISAQKHATDKVAEQSLIKCQCDSSRKEVVNLRDSLSTTNKFVYIVWAFKQLTLFFWLAASEY